MIKLQTKYLLLLLTLSSLQFLSTAGANSASGKRLDSPKYQFTPAQLIEIKGQKLDNGVRSDVHELIQKKYGDNPRFKTAAELLAKSYQLHIENPRDAWKNIAEISETWACGLVLVSDVKDLDEAFALSDEIEKAVVNTSLRSRSRLVFEMKLGGGVIVVRQPDFKYCSREIREKFAPKAELKK